MFVYFVATTFFSFIRFLGPIYQFCLRLCLWHLQKQLYTRTGENFTLSLRYDRYWPEVSLIVTNYQTRDWKPQFRFAIHRDMRGVVLDSLKFPPELRARGLGRYCVKWLKAFCRWFGFSFIVLGSYPEAEKFWEKMKFTAMEFDEWKKYWRQC